MAQYLRAIFVCVVAICATFLLVSADEWAVLVAGSNGWKNYRHQAAVSHAYQVVRSKGIKPENIITMMYDDIAHHKKNPFPGKIFTDYQYKDRYEGIQIDYRGRDVNVKNFLKVLKGDKDLSKSGKKVLKSGPEDNVFIFFSDHGSVNLVAFPNELLYADTLNDTFTWMHKNGLYKNMLVYIEACESGSMFKGILSEKIGIYATTSANPRQSGYACFCNAPEFDTCLGDEYSVAWTYDSETHDLKKRSISAQYEYVKENTERSEVCHYGDMSVGSQFMAKFQGDMKKTTQPMERLEIIDRLPAREVHLMQSHPQSKQENELVESEYEFKIKRAQLVQESFQNIKRKLYQQLAVNKLNTRDKRETLACYRELTDAYTTKCFSLQAVPEVAANLRIFDELCVDGVDVQIALDVIESTCA